MYVIPLQAFGGEQKEEREGIGGGGERDISEDKRGRVVRAVQAAGECPRLGPAALMSACKWKLPGHQMGNRAD